MRRDQARRKVLEALEEAAKLDTEVAHSKADEAIEQFLRDLKELEVADKFATIDKWYA